MLSPTASAADRALRMPFTHRSRCLQRSSKMPLNHRLPFINPVLRFLLETAMDKVFPKHGSLMENQVPAFLATTDNNMAPSSPIQYVSAPHQFIAQSVALFRLPVTSSLQKSRRPGWEPTRPMRPSSLDLEITMLTKPSTHQQNV